MVAAAPDHAVVRLVAENRDVLPAHELGEPFQIFERRDAAGRVVRAVQEIARGDLSLARNRRTSSRLGRKSFDAFSSDSTTRALRRNTFGG